METLARNLFTIFISINKMSIFKIKKAFRDRNYWFFREVEFPIDGIHEYIDNSDQLIENIRQSINKHEDNLDKWSKNKIKRSFDVVDYYTKKFSHQLYYTSIFITEYSFLERKMLELCKVAEPKQRLRINDIAGKGIFKYYNYFQRVLNVNMDDVRSEWTLILKYNQLRNLLVHHPTYILENTPAEKSRLQLLRSIEHLLIEERDNYIEFEITDKSLLIDFAETIREFLAGIYYDND